jgi:hypothetical protein
MRHRSSRRRRLSSDRLAKLAAAAALRDQLTTPLLTCHKAFFLIGAEAILFVTNTLEPRLNQVKLMDTTIGRMTYYAYVVHDVRKASRQGTSCTCIMEMMCRFISK